MSDKAYLKSGRARKLPIYECHMNGEWEELGKFSVVVARRHTNGNITAAILLVDIYCTGVKDAWYIFNADETEYSELIEKLYEMEFDMKLFDYELVHNVIYGAVEFAHDYGIEPVKEFRLASMILEKDDDHIPLMEIPLGHEGKPLLLLHKEDSRNAHYLRQLRKHAGEGNFDFIADVEAIGDQGLLEEGGDWMDDDLEGEDTEGHEEWDREQWKDFLTTADTDMVDPLGSTHTTIFERAIYDAEVAQRQLYKLALPEGAKMLTGLPENEVLPPEAEMRPIIEAFENLNGESSPEEQDRTINMVQAAIDKLPNATRLYDLLTITYDLCGKALLAEQTSAKSIELFPGAFFSKIVQGKMYLNWGEEDRLADIFKGFTIQEALPGTHKFYMGHYVAFNTLMSTYYLIKEDLVLAYHYLAMVLEYEVPDDTLLDEQHFMIMNIHVIGQVNLLIGEVRRDPNRLEELLDLLAME